MSEINTLDDAIRIQRERVARRTAAAERMFRQTCAGQRPQTPDPTPQQIDIYGPWLVVLLRDVIETWATCGGAVPQPLSDAIIAAKRACLQASAITEEGAADA